VFVLAGFLILFSGCGAGSGGGEWSPSPGNEGFPSSPGSGLDGEELKFLSIINAYRKENGLGELVFSPKLTQAADWLSRDMAEKGYFSHTDSLGRSAGARIDAFDYDASWGENIAWGNSSAEATFAQWKNSPAHNTNMLNPSWKGIGIGRAVGGTRWYWTTDFGSVAL
jgi:uncharacterized protein YkwD